MFVDQKLAGWYWTCHILCTSLRFVYLFSKKDLYSYCYYHLEGQIDQHVDLYSYSCFYFYLFQCNLVHILNEETWSGRLKSFSGTIWSALLYIFEHSYVSSVGSLTLLMASYSFVPSKLSRRRRAIIGGLHVLAHLTAALLLMLLLELGIEICIRNHLLATSGMPCHSVLPEFLS